MKLSLRQAADQCGKSRSTIHRALRSGKLSGERDEDGSWSIDPSELARVFPWDGHGHGHWDATGQQRATPETAAARAALGDEVMAVKVAMLEQQLEREQETVADLRKRLDRAEERVYALSAPSGVKPSAGATGEVQESAQGGLKGWLRRWL